MPYLIALLICAAAAALEGLAAGPAPMAQLKALRQPAWSPPVWAWVLIGLAWYGICFVALARLLAVWPLARTSVLLLAGMMAINAAANLFQFRMRRLDLAVFALAPYWLLLVAFLLSACPIDRPVCLLFAGYGLYLVYGTAWTWQLWWMNRQSYGPL